MDAAEEAAALELRLGAASRDLVAGAAAGACGVVAGAPLDLVRVRQQAAGAAPPPAAAVLRRAVAAEGWRAPFRGLAYPLATCALQNAVCFYAYGSAARWLERERPARAPLGTAFWAGCAAGAVQTAVVAPVDLLKIRMQLQVAAPGAPGYVGALATLRRELAAGGAAALYRGAAVTLLRDVPSYGVYFAAFDAARAAIDRPGGAARPAAAWAAGGLAGAASWLAVYPVDVVKTRVQAAAGGGGARAVAAALWRREGPRAFFFCLGATLARAVLVNGAIFSSYEAAHGWLGRARARE